MHEDFVLMNDTLYLLCYVFLHILDIGSRGGYCNSISFLIEAGLHIGFFSGGGKFS